MFDTKYQGQKHEERMTRRVAYRRLSSYIRMQYNIASVMVRWRTYSYRGQDVTPVRLPHSVPFSAREHRARPSISQNTSLFRYHSRWPTIPSRITRSGVLENHCRGPRNPDRLLASKYSDMFIMPDILPRITLQILLQL